MAELMPDPTAPTGTGSLRELDHAVPKSTDYRELQGPVNPLTPGELPSTGRASEAEALANTFRSFSGTADKLATEFGTKQGTQAGAAAGLDPGFQPKTGLAAITASGAAYNAAGAVSFKAQTETHVLTAIEAARAANEGDPIAFAKAAADIRQNILQETPAIFQPETATMIDRHIAAGQIRTGEQATANVRGAAVADWSTTQSTRFNGAVVAAAQLPQEQGAALVQQTLHDDQTQIDLLVKSGAMTPAQGIEQKAKSSALMDQMVNANYHTGTVERIMDIARAGDVDKADRLILAYENDPANSTTDKAAIRADYETQRDAFVKEQSRVHVADLASIAQRLSENAVGPGEGGLQIEQDIKALHRVGAMSDSEYVSNLKHAYENQEQGVKRDAVLGVTDDRLHGQGAPLDPKNAQDAKDLDMWWQHQPENQTEPVGSDRRTNALINIIKETGGMLPESERNQMRIALNSGNVSMATQTALNAERLAQANPTVDIFNDKHLEAISRQISDGIHSGLDQQTAYTLAETRAARASKDQAGLDKSYSKILKDYPDANAGALTNALSTSPAIKSQLPPGRFFGSAGVPDAPPQMQAEFNSLVKQFYDSNSDIAQARALAGRAITRTWGVTQVNGAPELTKYPLEQTSNTPAPAIRDDVAKSARAAGYTGDPANLHLIPDPVLGDRGVANVEHVDPVTGIHDVLRDNTGGVLRYQPPTADRDAIQKAKDDAATARRIAFRDQRTATAAEDDAVQKRLQAIYLRSK
jgi:hypothetical protein